MSIEFPNAPSFSTASLMPPPALSEYKTPEAKIDAIHSFLNAQYVSLMDMQSSIEAGWLIDTVRILNLEAGTITSGSIFTQTLYIGDQQKIILDGNTDTIEVYDAQATPRLRTRIGDLGTGTTNYGQEWWDSSGTLIMSVGDTVFISGAIIVDATITNAKIVNSTIDGSTKLANSSVTNGKIASGLSAAKVTAGTLTVSNSSVAIEVTSGGQVNLRNGADLVFEAASSGETSYLKFANSSGVVQGRISWTSSTDLFAFYSVSGDCQVFADGGDLQLFADNDIDMISAAGRIDLRSSGFAALRLDASGNIALDVGGTVCTINALFRPTAHKTHDLGTLTLAFDTIFVDDLTNVADLAFQNGMVILEADKVYKDCPGDRGEFFLLPNKTPGFLFDSDGNLHIKGRIIENVDFDKDFKQYKHIDYYERAEEKLAAKEIRQQEAKRAQKEEQATEMAERVRRMKKI